MGKIASEEFHFRFRLPFSRFWKENAEGFRTHCHCYIVCYFKRDKYRNVEIAISKVFYVLAINLKGFCELSLSVFLRLFCWNETAKWDEIAARQPSIILWTECELSWCDLFFQIIAFALWPIPSTVEVRFLAKELVGLEQRQHFNPLVVLHQGIEIMNVFHEINQYSSRFSLKRASSVGINSVRRTNQIIVLIF